jgi:hypothetical protein
VVATTDACRRWCDMSWTRVVLPSSYTRDAPKRSPVKVHGADGEHPGLNPGLHKEPSFPNVDPPFPANPHAKKPPDQRSRGSAMWRIAARHGVECQLIITRRRTAMCGNLDKRKNEPRARLYPWQSTREHRRADKPLDAAISGVPCTAPRKRR